VLAQLVIRLAILLPSLAYLVIGGFPMTSLEADPRRPGPSQVLDPRQGLWLHIGF